jgi:hypothetical protein
VFLTLSPTESRQGWAASNLEEVIMIRFDFDVVSDPLPPKPAAKPEPSAVELAKRRGSEAAEDDTVENGPRPPISQAASPSASG